MNREGSDRTDSRRRSSGAMLRSAVEETEPILQIESTVTFFVVAVLFVPIGLVVLVASVLLWGGLAPLIGTPAESVRTALGLAWLGLTIGVIFLVFRALYRRLPGRVRRHAVPGLPDTDAPNASSPAMSAGALPEGAAPTASPSLSELDARLAPEGPPS